MSAAARLLGDRILDELSRAPGQKASELARALGCERRDVNRCLSFELAGRVRQGSDYRWHLVEGPDSRPVEASSATTELSRLCRYYLECISQDMDLGASVFAQNQYGDPDYASLSSVPLLSGSDWWNAPGVGRLLGKARAESGKVMLWLGYPVRLRPHRTPRWEGFFVEPVFLWPVVLPAANGDAPSLDDHAPLINSKFLRSMAIGGLTQLAEEAAQLSEELGLGVPAEQLPDVEEMAERLVRIRADWDWREELDPTNCPATPPLANVTRAGIYNRAVIIPGERSPFTQGLETELRQLSGVPMEQIDNTALGRWLTGDAPMPTGQPSEGEPLLEVLPMNTEQRAAVQAALSAPHTVVTGPPGTGKSQVVTNLLVNAAWRGMKVLFASKNNKAVDVVEVRVNDLGNRPVLLRLGAMEYQARLAGYLTQLLAGNPGSEVKTTYDEALERHRRLAERQVVLDREQQTTLDARNAVDRLDADLDEFRQALGAGIGNLSPAVRDRAEADLEVLGRALNGVDRDRQGLVTRILWALVRSGRARNLAQAVQRASSTLKALQVSWPAWMDQSSVAALHERLETLRERVVSVGKLLSYREALRKLQSLPTFEDIASRRALLTEDVSDNSSGLWRAWVELASTRLSAAQRREVADYAAALQLITSQDGDRVHSSVTKRARELQSRITALFSCWAVTSLSAKGRIPLEPGYFDLVVIDEASQCDIASALPLLYRAKRSVIIGDPMQLRHISALTRSRDSELQHKYDLVETRLGWMYSVSSLFDVAASMVPSESLVNLRDHHRSHADIIGFSNDAFYEGRLRVATRYRQLKRPSDREPGIVWQHVHGAVSTPRGGGAENRAEAEAVVAAVADLLVTRGYAGTVGVVTPFRAQAQLLQQLLHAHPGMERVVGSAELLVDTVHKFQGDERDVMFFSPVVASGMSAGAVSFLRGNGNLFNVAITRARGLLHVVGDRAAAAGCGVDYLEQFASYVNSLDAARESVVLAEPTEVPLEYPTVTHPDRVSEWERVLYRAMVRAELRPIPQFSVEQYDLDFALIRGDRKLAVEVDGERYHRSWTGELCLRDQLRNQRLIELGWDVRRFWVYEVRDELDRCVQALRAWVQNASSAPVRASSP